MTSRQRRQNGFPFEAWLLWLLAVILMAWATVPPKVPEKVNVQDLRGAAQYQAMQQLTRK